MNVTKAMVTRFTVVAFAAAGVSLGILFGTSEARALVADTNKHSLTVQTNPAAAASAPLANSPQAKPTPPGASRSAVSPGVADVFRLLDANVSKEIVKAYIQNSPIAYNLSATEIITLKERAVPEDVVLAMLARGGQLRAEAAQARLNAPAPASLSAAPIASADGNSANSQYAPVPAATYAAAPAYSTAPYYYYWYSYPAYPTYSYWWWSPYLARYPHYYHRRSWPRSSHYPVVWRSPASHVRPYSHAVQRIGHFPGSVGAHRGFAGRPFSSPGRGPALHAGAGPGRGFRR